MSYGIKSPARYMQGNGELANLGRNVKKMGEKFLVLCSPNKKKRVGAQIEESLKSVEKEVVFCEFNGECTKAEITRVMDAVTENNCDVVIGVGGGKVIDSIPNGGVQIRDLYYCDGFVGGGSV